MSKIKTKHIIPALLVAIGLIAAMLATGISVHAEDMEADEQNEVYAAVETTDITAPEVPEITEPAEELTEIPSLEASAPAMNADAGQPEAETVTITFMNEDKVMTTMTAPKGGSISYWWPTYPIKAQEEAGWVYTFVGWNADPAAEEGTKDVMSITFTEDTTLYAIFRKDQKQCSISWFNNGLIIHRSSISYGEKPVFGGPDPVKTSEDGTVYVFTGWSEDPNAEIGTPEADLPVTVAQIPDRQILYHAIYVKADSAITDPEQGGEAVDAEGTGDEQGEDAQAAVNESAQGTDTQTAAVQAANAGTDAKAAVSQGVKTGDENRMIVWLIVSMASLAAAGCAAGVILHNRKKRFEK